MFELRLSYDVLDYGYVYDVLDYGYVYDVLDYGYVQQANKSIRVLSMTWQLHISFVHLIIKLICTHNTHGHMDMLGRHGYMDIILHGWAC